MAGKAEGPTKTTTPSEDKTVEPTAHITADSRVESVAQYIDEVSLEQRRVRVDWGLDF